MSCRKVHRLPALRCLGAGAVLALWTLLACAPAVRTTRCGLGDPLTDTTACPLTMTGMLRLQHTALQRCKQPIDLDSLTRYRQEMQAARTPAQATGDSTSLSFFFESVAALTDFGLNVLCCDDPDFETFDALGAWPVFTCLVLREYPDKEITPLEGPQLTAAAWVRRPGQAQRILLYPVHSCFSDGSIGRIGIGNRLVIQGHPDDAVQGPVIFLTDRNRYAQIVGHVIMTRLSAIELAQRLEERFESGSAIRRSRLAVHDYRRAIPLQERSGNFGEP